jgi:hypothetical protein
MHRKRFAIVRLSVDAAVGAIEEECAEHYERKASEKERERLPSLRGNRPFQCALTGFPLLVMALHDVMYLARAAGLVLFALEGGEYTAWATLLLFLWFCV